LLGLAAGDAVGTTVEFRSRGSFPPVTDMTGGGPFNLQPGQWTDDTSLALCLATSLVEKGGFDARDQMERYCRWRDEGYLSSTGECFDIGRTTVAALRRYRDTGEPFSGPAEERSAGNGSIMRLAPVPLFFHPDREQVLHYSAESSRTTHGAPECLDGCRLLGDILCRALGGADRRGVLLGTDCDRITAPAIRRIAGGEYFDKPHYAVLGTGYVVDSLEAALWCFWTTNSFEEAILKAVNLGDDADTTAAVCGQVAGAHYGEGAIPSRWLARLALRDEIGGLAERLCRAKPRAAG
jgi:ADP-ribosyl-[dinitrogen reductase] hydrolase